MKVAVIGSGSWGTALSMAIARASHDIKIFSRNAKIVEEINNYNTNLTYIPNIKLPANILASSNLKDAIDNDILFLAVPAQNILNICLELKKLDINSNKILVICSKGIERNSLKLMSEVVADILPNNPIAVLSGPNFAIEIAQNLPAITSIACEDINLATSLSKFFTSNNFRVYPNDDIVGTQILGAAKNVLAIAVGIAIGKEYGENAKAAIVSRGIHEIVNLITAKGGKLETLVSPAGIGDAYLTCSSSTSRNTSYGIKLGQNNAKDYTFLVEGFVTSESIVKLANKYNVQMPICQSVYLITHENLSLDKVVQELLERPIKFN